MSITPGRTNEEIREFVHQYALIPHGKKGLWLAEQGVTQGDLRRWASVIYAGDVDRGLIPRESRHMSIPPGKRIAFERGRASERAAHEAEIAALTARVTELEGVNDALGKAIGLLHQLNEHEPEKSTETELETGPGPSSPPKTNSSPN